MMQDPVKTVKDIIEGGWELTDVGLKATDITWRQGAPEDMTTRFMAKTISAEFSFLTIPKDKRSLIRARAHMIVTADFWMLVTPNKTSDDMYADRRKIIDEVEEIVAANERIMTDLDLVYIAAIRRLDRESDRIVRTQFELVCLYQT